MRFVSPTCIQYRNSKITEMFPHRIAVFYSILAKWNQICPERLRFGLVRDDFGRYLIEQPEPRSYKTHSVMVNTIFDRKKEHARPIFRQGFTSSCLYRFATKTPISVQNATVALALFAKFSGVGSGVSRGCGQITTTITEGDSQ
jgi:CRISPR-associated endoribonuclease Cas6